MQLQIQTVQQDRERFQSLNNQSSQAFLNQAFHSTKIYEPTLTLLTQLRQIQLCSKADYHYLNNLRIKTFKTLSEQDFQSQLALVQKAFLSFKCCVLENKIQRTQQKLFLQNLAQNFSSQYMSKIKTKKAKQFYQKRLQKRIFQEFSSFFKIQKKSRIIERFLIKNKNLDLIMYLKLNMKRKKEKRTDQEIQQLEINRIFTQKTLKKYFTAFKISTRQNKLQRSIKTKAFRKLCSKILSFQRQKRQILLKFQQKKTLAVLKKTFQILKQTKLQSQCFDWYCYRLQKLYFRKWLNYSSILKNQQQIDTYNEVIVQYFIDSKSTKQKNQIQNKYFGFWKSFTIFHRQQKKETEILKSFAQLKEKQYLERKYFQILKNNKNIEKAIRFYQIKSKLKVLQGFKRNLIKQSEKIQKVYKFIQKRRLKKYFDRIQLFVKNENTKTKSFKLQVAWQKFTFVITMQYFQKIQKAKNYYQTLLKFKSLIGLKQSLKFNKKAEHCQLMIMATLPMKRWVLRFRIKRLVNQKQFSTLKRIMFQWKVLTMRKTLSLQKQVQNSQLFVESRIALKKRKQQSIQQIPIYSHNRNQISEIQKKYPSFFMKMEQSDSQDDQVDKKVNDLMTKIQNKKKLSIKELSATENQVFTNEKLSFANKSISKNYAIETGERVRMPTWSSPDSVYKVSVFSDNLQDD